MKAKGVKAILDMTEPSRLPGVIDIWLWEFEHPENWPKEADVKIVIKELERRKDAGTPPVRSAIKKCLDYIAPKR